MRRTAAALGTAVLLVGAGVGAWQLFLRPSKFRLPDRVFVSDVVLDLTENLAPDTVVERPAGAVVEVQGMQPNVYRGYRRAIAAPPGTALRWRAPVPSEGWLRFGIGVGRASDAPEGGAPIRFEVDVEGDTVFRRTLDPGQHRKDRRWYDEKIDLEEFAGREVAITLRTAQDGEGTAAGVPGWSRVQVAREQLRERQPASADAPNVLVLLVDTLRADRLGCYGQAPSPSPTLDALAQSGLVFEQAIAQAPWTLPSVASILTGLYPRWHGVVGRAAQFGLPPGASAGADWAFLSDAIPTLATAAARAGISTAGVSSNPLVSRENNLAHGFESFRELPIVAEKWTPASEVNRHFLRWLRANRDRRFFAWLQYMEPHSPYTPPDDLRPPEPPGLPDDVRKGTIKVLAENLRRGDPPLPARDVGYLLALYDAAIRSWDRQLAALLAELEALGLRDRTLIVVTADHGEEFQDHGQLGHQKQLYDESIHVPLVLVGPGIAPGRQRAQAQGIDLFPTLAAVLGFAPPSGLPGRNLLAGAPAAPRPAFSETNYGLGPGGEFAELLGLRQPEAKVVWAPALDRHQLYDLIADPGEHHDRWDGDSEDAALARELTAFRDAAPSPPPPSGIDPTLGEKLRALGYVH